MLRSYIDSIVIDDKELFGPSSKRFVDELNKLDKLVGLQEIKNKVVKHVHHAISEMKRGITEENFHNVIITGEQGRGKTELAKCIGGIFTSLGYFKGESKKKKREVSIDVIQLNKVMRYLLKMSKDYDGIPKSKKSKGISKLTNRKRRSNSRALIITYISSLLSKIYPSIIIELDDIIDGILSGKYDKESETVPSYDLLSIVDMVLPKNAEELPKFGVCRVLGKSDIVGGYVGHTAPKCKTALESCKGGAFILDEAYSLLNTSKDPCTFGLEALNTINQYMSEHPISQMVIFLGYKDMIKGLYENQRGLYRRFNWIYNIDDYSYTELSDIFISTLPRNLKVDIKRDKLDKLFKKEESIFFNGAGDCINLKQFSIVEMDWCKDDVMTLKHVKLGVKVLKSNRKELVKREDLSHVEHIYM